MYTWLRNKPWWAHSHQALSLNWYRVGSVCHRVWFIACFSWFSFAAKKQNNNPIDIIRWQHGNRSTEIQINNKVMKRNSLARSILPKTEFVSVKIFVLNLSARYDWFGCWTARSFKMRSLRKTELVKRMKDAVFFGSLFSRNKLIKRVEKIKKKAATTTNEWRCHASREKLLFFFLANDNKM